MWYCKIVVVTAVFMMSSAIACTGIQVKTKDDSFINGRTVEFGMPLQLNVIVIPRNYSFKGTLPNGASGLIYQSKYAVVGGNTFDEPAIIDGVNEKGLVAAAFYFPGYAQYSQRAQDNSQSLSPTEFPNWILTQFSTVDEVKQNLKSVAIAPTIPKGWPVMPPLHYVIYDRSGKSIVIEPIKGELKVYDNPLGVITNSPDFNWQMTNLVNYINLSPVNASPVTINGFKMQPFGQGSGLRGLPGDFTPPSRFVRAAIFSTNAISVKNATAAVFQVFHILNQFDIPVGAVRDVRNNQVIPEFTLATTVKDPQNFRYYFRTFDDQTIKVINLKVFDPNAKVIKVISMVGNQPVTDVSSTAK
jgi:choloylglycine hydrolase